MKNIVLYALLLSATLLVTCTESVGQKPTIDLLPNSNRRTHPEAIIDTSQMNDSLINAVSRDQSFYDEGKNKQNKRFRKRNQQRTGIQLDAIFQRQVSKKAPAKNSSGKFLLILKYFNPIKIVIHITALKI